jgi:hypothetical protein
VALDSNAVKGAENQYSGPDRCAKEVRSVLTRWGGRVACDGNDVPTFCPAPRRGTRREPVWTFHAQRCDGNYHRAGGQYRKALTSEEAACLAVQYIPRKNVDMTHCKGHRIRGIVPTRASAPITAFRWRGTLGQRHLELRDSLCRRIGNPGIPGVLPGPSRRHRSRRRRLSRPSWHRSHLLEQDMTTKTEDKPLDLEAFDTLFNKRD